MIGLRIRGPKKDSRHFQMYNVTEYMTAADY